MPSPKRKGKNNKSLPRAGQKSQGQAQAKVVLEKASQAASGAQAGGAARPNPGPPAAEPAKLQPVARLASVSARPKRRRSPVLMALPWLMLGVLVVVVFSSLRGVMTGSPTPPKTQVPPKKAPAASAVFTKNKAKAKFLVKVVTPKLNLRAQPAVYSALLGQIPKGSILLVMKTKGEWFRVISGGGRKGWVNANPAYTKRVKE